MRNRLHTLPILLAAAFAASAPVHADSDVDAVCETNGFLPEWADPRPELPYSTFRLEILPDSGRKPGYFVATITRHTTATVELMRPTRACRLELTVDDCPAIADVADAVEQLDIPIGKGHAASLERIALHATTYRLQVRGPYLHRHSVSYYSELDNPIAGFMHDARERLLACVPQAIQDFIYPPSNP